MAETPITAFPIMMDVQEGSNEYARPFGTWNYCPRCGAKMDGET